MVVTYILFLLTILYLFPHTFDYKQLRTDYYESFSSPIKCLVVSHYHINGPQFLFVTINYEAYKYDGRQHHDYWSTFFKKIYKKCHNSVIFKTIIDDLKKIDLKIGLYLHENIETLNNIEYTFYKGISAGNFQLWDLNEHFSVFVKILNDFQEFSTLLNFSSNVKLYLNSISKNRGDLCIETRFTGPIVLTPKYVSNKPDGLITNLKVYLFLNGSVVGYHNYSAFECNKTQLYPNKPIILIVDKPKFDIKFKAIAIKLSERKKIEREYEFKLPYVGLIYVNYMNYIPENTDKLYLVKSKLKIIKCIDGTKHVAYLSNDDTIYYVEEYTAKNVTSYLKRKLYISHPLDDEC